MSENTTPAEVKKPRFCEKDFSAEGIGTFSFSNGTILNFDINELSETQKFNLMMHGLMQKIGDSYASCGGEHTLAIAAAQKTWDNLLSDQWTASRASAGEGKPRSGELAQALANVKKLDLAAVSSVVEKATDEQRKAWRKHPAIAAEIARIRAAKAAERAAKAQEEATSELDLGI